MANAEKSAAAEIARNSLGMWDSPSILREWIDAAFGKAIQLTGATIEVRVPWWRRILGTPYPDTLSVRLDSLPNPGGGAIRMIVLCATSDSAAVLVANLALALRVTGGNPGELVKSFEIRKSAGVVFMHAIAFIPGSVKG